MFIGLNKTTQKHGRRKRNMARDRIKSYVLKQMYRSINDEICNSIEIFWLENQWSGHLPEDGHVRPKHVAVDCDFIVILN
jgi:hypothetical protein